MQSLMEYGNACCHSACLSAPAFQACLDAHILRAQTGCLEESHQRRQQLRLSFDARHANDVQVPLPADSAQQASAGAVQGGYLS